MPARKQPAELDLPAAIKRLLDAGDHVGAMRTCEAHVAKWSSDPDGHRHLAQLLAGANEFAKARRSARRACELAPQDPRCWSDFGRVCAYAGQFDAAARSFARSVELDPDFADGWHNLGTTLKQLNDRDGAFDALPTPIQRARFGPVSRANAARRRASGTFDRAAQTKRVDRIIEAYTSDFFRERARFGVDSEQPVFIVGLPRSGTTLTEQILSSHPQMYGAGELPDLARVAGHCIGVEEELWQAAARLDIARSRERANEYLKALRNGAPKRSVRVSDKSPLNLFQLAFVATLFPKARVVHCRRDARDNALSIWMENFSTDQRYATDFEDLAHFTAQYRRLMAHWRVHLPLPMLELYYEDTVADLEAQARKLCRFLDVDWDARCLDFHESARAVQTPSRWQVREPVYTRSVERWRNYSAHLPQLVSAF